jgi:hypothetical protein
VHCPIEPFANHYVKCQFLHISHLGLLIYVIIHQYLPLYLRNLYRGIEKRINHLTKQQVGMPPIELSISRIVCSQSRTFVFILSLYYFTLSGFGFDLS